MRDVPRRVAVFMGAGASRAFGYPLTRDIFPAIWARARDEKLFWGDRAACRELKSGLTDLLPGLSTVSEVPLITHVLSLIDQSVLLTRSPAPGQDIARLQNLRLLLERAVCEVIGRAKPEPGESRLLKRFVAWLKRHRRRVEVGVVSTNYDTCVEQVLFDEYFDRTKRARQTRVAWSTVTHRRIAEEFDFGFGWRMPYENRIAEFRGTPRFRWYKLHGSLNWVGCDLCEHIYVNPDWPINDLAYDKVSSANTCHCGHAKLRPVIVAPSYVRDMRDSNLIQIWRNALEFLRRAEDWYLIGYSLPAEDVAIRSLLVRAYNGREQRPSVTVVTKEADPELKARFEVFFPRTRFSTDGVEGLVS